MSSLAPGSRSVSSITTFSSADPVLKIVLPRTAFKFVVRLTSSESVTTALPKSPVKMALSFKFTVTILPEILLKSVERFSPRPSIITSELLSIPNSPKSPAEIDRETSSTETDVISDAATA